jgi:glyoxylase-like metal-dependent hydrolase (beta-lactamase superfamily II)
MAPEPLPGRDPHRDGERAELSDAVKLIDLHQAGHDRVLGVFVLTGERPMLVDCGPTSCLQVLRGGLAREGLAVTDLHDLLLTHVHFDHAGATGALVAENPDLLVHVSAEGAAHLIDPERLERSARRLFGARFDRLWGEITPVPAERIRVLGDSAAGLECIPAPGHAKHHVAFFTPDGTAFTGDVTGVCVAPSTYVAAATPPPDIDLAGYARSLAQIEARSPRRLCLPHFGFVEDPPAHLAAMRESLARWSGWINDGVSQERFVELAEAELEGLAPDVVEAIRVASPFAPSYLGLKRHHELASRLQD